MFSNIDIEKAKEIKAKGFNWIAKDFNGSAFAYAREPMRSKAFWVSVDGHCIKVEGDYFSPISFANMKATRIDDIIANNADEDSNTVVDSYEFIIKKLMRELEKHQLALKDKCYKEAMMSGCPDRCAVEYAANTYYEAALQKAEEELRKAKNANM